MQNQGTAGNVAVIIIVSDVPALWDVCTEFSTQKKLAATPTSEKVGLLAVKVMFAVY